jgi:ABC-type lipoprotein export system ATPase subunit
MAGGAARGTCLAVVAVVAAIAVADASSFNSGASSALSLGGPLGAPPQQENNAMYYYLDPLNQGVQGPYDAQVLVAWYRSGALPSSTLVSRCRPASGGGGGGGGGAEDEQQQQQHYSDSWHALAQLEASVPPPQQDLSGPGRASPPAKSIAFIRGPPRLTEWYEEGEEPLERPEEEGGGEEEEEEEEESVHVAFDDTQHSGLIIEVDSAADAADALVFEPPPLLDNASTADSPKATWGLPVETGVNETLTCEEDAAAEEAPSHPWWQEVIEEVVALPPQVATRDSATEVSEKGEAQQLEAEYGSLLERAGKMSRPRQFSSPPSSSSSTLEVNDEYRSLVCAATSLCDSRKEIKLQAQRRRKLDEKTALAAAEAVSYAYSKAITEAEVVRTLIPAETPQAQEASAIRISSDLPMRPLSSDVDGCSEEEAMNSGEEDGNGDDDPTTAKNATARHDIDRHEGTGRLEIPQGRSASNLVSVAKTVHVVAHDTGDGEDEKSKFVHVTSHRVIEDNHLTQRQSVAYSFTSPEAATTSIVSTETFTTPPSSSAEQAPERNIGDHDPKTTGTETFHPANAAAREERQEENNAPRGEVEEYGLRYQQQQTESNAPQQDAPSYEAPSLNMHQSSLDGFNTQVFTRRGEGSSPMGYNQHWGQLSQTQTPPQPQPQPQPQPSELHWTNAVWPPSDPFEAQQQEGQIHSSYPQPGQSSTTCYDETRRGDVSCVAKQGLFSGLASGLRSSSSGLAEKIGRANFAKRLSFGGRSPSIDLSTDPQERVTPHAPLTFTEPAAVPMDEMHQMDWLSPISPASPSWTPASSTDSPTASLSQIAPDESTPNGRKPPQKSENCPWEAQENDQRINASNADLVVGDSSMKASDTVRPKSLARAADKSTDLPQTEVAPSLSAYVPAPIASPRLPPPLPPLPSTVDASSFDQLPVRENGGGAPRAVKYVGLHLKRLVLSPLARSLPLIRSLHHLPTSVRLTIHADPISTLVYPGVIAVRAIIVPFGLLLIALSAVSFADSLGATTTGARALYPLRAAARAAADAAKTAANKNGQTSRGSVPLVDLSRLILEPSGLLDEALGPNVLGRFLTIVTGNPDTNGLAIGPILDPIQRAFSPLLQYLAAASPWQSMLPPSMTTFPDSGDGDARSDVAPTSAALLPLISTLARPLCVVMLVVILYKMVASIEVALLARIERRGRSVTLKELDEFRLRCAARSVSTLPWRHDDNIERKLNEVCGEIDDDTQGVAQLPAAHVRAMGAVVASAAAAAGTFVASAWLFTALADPNSPLNDSSGLFMESGLFKEGTEDLSAISISSLEALWSSASRHLTTMLQLIGAVFTSGPPTVPPDVFENIGRVWPALLCLAWVAIAVGESYMDTSVLEVEGTLPKRGAFGTVGFCARQLLLRQTGAAEVAESRLHDAPRRLLPAAIGASEARPVQRHVRDATLTKNPIKVLFLYTLGIAKLCCVLIWRAVLGGTLAVVDGAAYLLLAHGALCCVLTNLAYSSTGPPGLNGGADPLTGDLIKRLTVLGIATLLLLNGHAALRSTAESMRGLNAAAARSSIITDFVTIRERICAVTAPLVESVAGQFLPLEGPVPTDGLRLDDVWVAYHCRNSSQLLEPHYVIRGLTTHAPGGSILVLLGFSGSGKSSLLEAIAWATTSSENDKCAPHAPFLSHGSVTLQGRPRRQWGIAPWLQQLAFLRQKYARFRMSVADNIAIGSSSRAFQGQLGLDGDGSREAAVKVALKFACASDFVNDLPAQLKTLLVDDSAAPYEAVKSTDGEGATAALASGEWTTIARARTLSAFNTSRLVLLDDPTNGMSEDDENTFMMNLREAVDRAPHQPVVVIATQRAQLAKVADVVEVLEPGKTTSHEIHDI